MPLNAALDKLKATREGLSSDEAQKRILEHGPNALPKVEVNKLLVFLGFMWNPLSWAMEVAAILSIILLDFPDFGLIMALLLLNACIGYFEEMQAGDAVSALMGQLAPECKVFRDGAMVNLPADQLVPGDVIRIRLGDVLPADVKFLEGDSVKIDQSSLTGESLPVTKSVGDEGYSGSICKQGEIEAVVTSTGVHTFLGRAAEQIAGVDSHGRLQEVLTTVGNFCMVSIIVWCIIELVVQMGARKDENPCLIITDGCLGVANILVLIVGGIPVAMPTVLSVTLAIGSSALAKENAIVTRLTSIEEMASMEILCSDKTGTLTLNKLSVDLENLIPYNDYTADDILLYGALSARIENNEAIDVVCHNTYPGNATMWEKYTLLHYTPFDPTTKRTIAKVKDNATGRIFRACKGAPQVCLDMDDNAEVLRKEVEGRIDEYASRGYRGLGVSFSEGDVPLEEASWKLVGILPLFDPPRHDTADTVKRAIELGVAVKMVTGDHRVIAIETCRQLGMPTNILDTSFFNQAPPPGVNLAQMVYETDGFAQVFPEHKFEIVRQLQSLDKIVGMTGDGVNDAPALAQADIGIAVDDATDAARAAADIVLVSPGLSVIITAIRMSREIFLRMKNYAMYSIAMTVRIVLTFGLLTVCWNWYFPTILVVVLAILNDGTILTISKDNVTASRSPDSWKLKQVFVSSICFGIWLTISTVVLFGVAYNTSAFEGFIDAENLCVNCLKDTCDDFFMRQVQECSATNSPSICGELDGSVFKNGTATAYPDLATKRSSWVKAYEADYNDKSKTGKFDDIFLHLKGSHINDLGREPSAREIYEQFVAQYSASEDSIAGAKSGQGVQFVGHGYLPLTNGVSYCDFVWGYSNFNSTWTKNHKNIGPGMQKKDASSALIFVTRTAGINTWFFAEKPCNLLLVAFVFAQVVASVIGYYGFNGYPSDRIAVFGCGGGYLVIAWLWSIVWHFPLDLIKFAVNYVLNANTYQTTAFDSRINAGHPSMAHSRVTQHARSTALPHLKPLKAGCLPADVSACKTGCAAIYQDTARFTCPCYSKMGECLVRIGCSFGQRKDVMASCTRKGYCKAGYCTYRVGDYTPKLGVRSEIFAKSAIAEAISPCVDGCCPGGGTTCVEDLAMQRLRQPGRAYRFEEPHLPPRQGDPRLSVNQNYNLMPYSIPLSNLPPVDASLAAQEAATPPHNN
ncbi:P-type ATPase (P-ATPase) Superfamily [Achlya hypogyna]|uniref:Plasma membrane ATPase n=1 Tax=Achlya hypogyna TaxID=1202772 RepID=A0A1V9ZPS8_ACHHY|nr:P-type ATPase (P-ATPase) Superfamily [Achlya hypogyna]